MSNYATRITADSCPPSVTSDARRRFSDACGGRDFMDEPRRQAPMSSSEAVPVCGPRGGSRRPIFIGNNFADEVCEDLDAEDTVIARIDARRTAEWLGLEFVGGPSDEQIDQVARAIETRVREDEEAALERESVAPPATTKRRRIVEPRLAPRQQGVIEAGFDFDPPRAANEPVLAAAAPPPADLDGDPVSDAREEYRRWLKVRPAYQVDRAAILASDRLMSSRMRTLPKPRIARQLRFN